MARSKKPKPESDGNAVILQKAVREFDALPVGYPVLLDQLKERIRTAQMKAAISVNRELIALYWDIGRTIVERQQAEGWGKSVVDRLARDLQAEFPGISGFSPSNMWRMRSFYVAWSDQILAQAVREISGGANLAQPVRELDDVNLPQPVADLPWGHNITLIEKVKDRAERLWYAQKTIENGWSRAVLVHQIESGLYRRQGSAVSNFHATLPAPQSELAQQLLKDPYVFDFLMLDEAAKERDLELALLAQIERFLLELGTGFSFMGRQYHLEVGGEDFYLDLLFYHVKLHCYVIVELKIDSFRPEYAGKMNFYLAAVDDLLREPVDKPSIGLIICKEKNQVVVEYSLRDTRKPMGVAEYVLTQQLPAEFSESLPTVEDVIATVHPAVLQVQGGRVEARVDVRATVHSAVLQVQGGRIEAHVGDSADGPSPTDSKEE